MSSPNDGSTRVEWEREGIQLLAGVIDLGLEQVEGALHWLRGLLGRSDLGALAGDGHEDLRARGELALRRCAPSAESHFEALARHAAATRAGAPDA